MADAYERLAEKTELSYEEALALKEEIRKRNETSEPAAEPLDGQFGWRVTTKMSTEEALRLLNHPPLTQPGEGIVTLRPDGKFDVYWFGPIF